MSHKRIVASGPARATFGMAFAEKVLRLVTPKITFGILMVDVIEINDPEQLESYRMLWNSLLPRTPRASFFHTFDWFVTFWKHFGNERRMRVLVIQAAGSPIGIVPFCVQNEQYHIGRVRVLTFPLSDWGMWYGPIGPNQSACMFMAMKHLRNTRRDWDIIDLRWTPPVHDAGQTTGRAMHAAGWQPQQSVYQQTSVIRLGESDWETYFATRPKKWRHETRRQQRALERSGNVEFIRHRPDSASCGDGEPRWDLYDDCLAVSRNSWQAQSNTGNTLCHEHVSSFIRDCHQVAARMGMLDLTLLKVNGQPVAYQYNYIYDGNIVGLRMGYDAEFSRNGVGNVLLNHSIEDSFERRDEVIDLGIGDFPFKRRLRTKVETSTRFFCFPWHGWRSPAVRLTRWMKQRRTKSSDLPQKGESPKKLAAVAKA